MSDLTYRIRVTARSVIHGNGVLYKAYLSVRGAKGDLPDPATRLFLTGFGRSGNTFAATLLRNCYPDLRFKSHLHTVGSLKIALRRRVPVFVLIRDPLEAVPSAVVKNAAMGRRRSPDDLIREYIDYYSFVAANVNRLIVVDFEHLIGKPGLVIRYIADVCDLEQPPCEESFQQALDRTLAALKNDSREPALNTWHSAEKEALKHSVRLSIADCEQFQRTIDLYRTLSTRGYR